MEISNEEILTELEILNKNQSELNMLIQFYLKTEIKENLINVFNKPEELKAFQLTDGNRTSSEIGLLVGKSQKTISDWWKKWESEFGIVETEGYKNPYRSKYSLVELALIFGKE